MNSREFDHRFAAREDVSEALDWTSACYPMQAKRRINVDLPIYIVAELDRAALRHACSRQSVIRDLIRSGLGEPYM